MSRHLKTAPETVPPAKGVVHTVRGNARNMWDKPPGQKPSRLEPPTYEIPGQP